MTQKHAKILQGRWSRSSKPSNYKTNVLTDKCYSQLVPTKNAWSLWNSVLFIPRYLYHFFMSADHEVVQAWIYDMRTSHLQVRISGSRGILVHNLFNVWSKVILVCVHCSLMPFFGDTNLHVGIERIVTKPGHKTEEQTVVAISTLKGSRRWSQSTKFKKYYVVERPDEDRHSP